MWPVQGTFGGTAIPSGLLLSGQSWWAPPCLAPLSSLAPGQRTLEQMPLMQDPLPLPSKKAPRGVLTS